MIKKAEPRTWNFAERLIAHETAASKSTGAATSPDATPPAFAVYEKLSPHLATFLGKVGFGALLSRALALAGSEVPWLRALRVDADGSLQGLHDADAQVGTDEIAKGGIVLLAQLLGLLATFIGEDLTLRLVHEVWPKLPFDDPGFGKGSKNDKPD